jgi:Fe-S-cluster containining protein
MYITDPNEVARLAALQAEQNAHLKVRVKQIPTRQLDEIVATVAKDVIAAIDCTQCANCCKTLEPELSESEIERLAQHRQETRAAFEKKFLGYDPQREVHYLKPVCTFLQDNRCSAYPDRPIACREYPRLVPDLKFRWKKTMQDYHICPIVFNTMEILRTQLGESKDVSHG